MKTQKELWIIRANESSPMKGPHSTAEILRMIQDGSFQGSEEIAHFPEGLWRPLAREPKFYDALMSVMEGQIKAERRSANVVEDPATEGADPTRRPNVVYAETIFMPPPPDSDPQEKVAEVAVVKQQFKPPQSVTTPAVQEPAVEAVLEMRKLETEQKRAFLSTIRWPVVILIAAIVLIGYALLPDSSGPSDDKINLIPVGRPGAPIPDAEVKKRFGAILHHIEQDTFEDNLQAENKLISLIEAAPSNLEIRSTLCWVYKELWPYSRQDAADQRTVIALAQSTRVLDVSSPYGSLCEVTSLMTSGRFREARGAVENILETSGTFSMQPVVYALKAELLEGDKDLQIAQPYYEKAAQYWDRWAEPKLKLGFLNLNIKNEAKAEEWFQSVLAIAPNNKRAQIGLAFAHKNAIQPSDGVLKQLSVALHTKGRLPASFESQAWQLDAELLLEKGDKSESLNAATKALRLNPNNEPARQLVVRLGGSETVGRVNKHNNELVVMGDQYARQGDCLSAQAEFKAAFELDPKNGTAAMKAAKCLWTLNQSYEAIDWLSKAIHADKSLISAYVLQSDYLSQRYDFTGAAEALMSATRVLANNAEVLRGQALLEYRKNNMIGTLNYAQRAMKVFDADPATYILLSQASLNIAQGIQSTERADVERKDAAFKDAIRYATKAVEFDSTNPEAQVAFAKMLAVTSGTDSAISYLQDLIKKYAFSFEYRLALAEVNKEAERWNDVRLICEQIVDSDPRNKKGWLLLGEAYRATGFTDKALKAFLSSAVIDPTDGEGLFQAGRLYLEGNHFQEALQQFVRVREMNAHFPRASYYAGKAAFALGKFDDAVHYANDEKRINPNLADSYILLAEVDSAKGAYGQCATEYAQAIKLRPSGAEIYVKSAQCYRQAGSLEIAGTMLTLAMERESGYPELYRETGALFEKKNDTKEAIRAYEKYMELAPNAPDHKEIESRVHRLGG